MSTVTALSFPRPARLPVIDPSDGGLACPACGCNNLHHDGIRYFTRCEDDEDVQVVMVGGYEEDVRVTTRPNSGSGNPSGRRSGMVVQFYCEVCPVLSSLAIYQHKGTTYIEWTDRIA
jgi:hypothetical protein